MHEVKPGLFASARGLLLTSVRLLQVRVELLATDMEVGVLRLFDAIILAQLALLGIGLGLASLCGLLLLIVQDAYRLHLLAVMATAFLLAGVAALVVARRKLAQAGAAFDATRSELARDIKALTPRE